MIVLSNVLVLYAVGKGLSFWRYLGPADVEIMLMNGPVMAGDWLRPEKFMMTLTLNRWIQIDIVRCC